MNSKLGKKKKKSAVLMRKATSWEAFGEAGKKNGTGRASLCRSEVFLVGLWW